MEIPPGILKILESLGVNTTRLQWKMYEREKKREQQKEQGTKLPSRVHWLNYPHKFCWKCNALNSREDKNCHQCGARLPSRMLYLVMRSLGLFVPQTGTPVTFTLMAVCLIVYVLTVAMSGGGLFASPQSPVMAIFGTYFPHFTTMFSGHPDVVAFHEALEIREPFGYTQWRLLAFGLLHGGIIHIGFNLFCLFQIGPLLEANIKPLKFLVLCTITQLGAAFATYGWYIFRDQHPFMSTVGASGIMFGLIGFGVSFFAGAGGAGEQIRRSLMQWAVYAFVFGLLMGANNAAHAGGFVAGYLLGQLPVSGPAARATDRFWTLSAAASAVLWIVTIITMVTSVVINVTG